jgi:hypothetical protein
MAKEGVLLPRCGYDRLDRHHLKVEKVGVKVGREGIRSQVCCAEPPDEKKKKPASE